MNVPKIMVFRPTIDEFKDFSRYIQYMESQGAHLGGIAKVIPPKEWVPSHKYDNIDNLIIPAPIEQVVSGQKGLYTQYNIQKKAISVKDFRRLTNTARYLPPFHESYEELERIYWKNITFSSPIYGADISGSLYDDDVDVWNVARLNTLLDVIENDSGVKIEGVNTAYLYFGMWKTTFAWHTEDMDLYSINYVHFGAPKSWYAIPPEHGKRLERLAAGFYPNDKSNCSSFLRHKMTLISPSVLKEYGIPVNKITQEAGEFIITFPYGYHAGFNHGFNCAESTNFASERWINYGKAAEKCTCRNDTVSIDMDVFVKLFQPEQYACWKFQRPEVKVLHNELPVCPDLTAAFPSWKTRIEECRKQCDISELLEKLDKCRHRKSVKPKPQHPRSPPKSFHRKAPIKQHKKIKELPGNVELADFAEEISVPPVSADHIYSKVDMPSCSSDSSSYSGPFTVCSGTSGSLMQRNQSLFDRVKRGARRKSSAKPLASKDDIDRPSIETSLAVPNMPNKSDRDHSIKSSTCSVKCETISSLPLKVISMKPFVVKEQKSSERNRKRRHPVSGKSTKKNCSRVLAKSDSISIDGTDKISKVPSINDVMRTRRSPKFDFDDEKAFNERVAKFPPFCAICMLFQPYHEAPVSNLSTAGGLPFPFPESPSGPPEYVVGDRTRPLISEVSFASNLTTPSPLAECQLLDDEGRSPLIQCCQCGVQVHASCYGVEKPPENPATPWTCVRCEREKWTARCILCCMLGGALKPIKGGSNWAHIVCAVAIPEVFFENAVHRDNINISKLPAKSFKLKCVYGGQPCGWNGVCLQCCLNRCNMAFHATCAMAAGILVEPGNWPFPVYGHCHKHTLLRSKGKQENHQNVEVGSYVLAQHKNGKYYQARVIKLKKENFFKAHFFKDNTWSNNLYAQDFVSHDWTTGEFPTVGSIVEVKWTDGLIYDAEYRGHSVQESIQVEFDDGLLLDCDRSEIFTDDDPLPARIRRKLKTHPPHSLKSVGAE